MSEPRVELCSMDLDIEEPSQSVTVVPSAHTSPVSDAMDIDIPDSPGNSSLVLDLTAEELDFINNVENEYYTSQERRDQSPGSTMENSISLDDNTYAFFVEAGLNDPEELAMLGIDIEEIRNQKAIAERLEQQIKRDAEAAAALQRQLEQEATTTAQHVVPRPTEEEQQVQISPVSNQGYSTALTINPSQESSTALTIKESKLSPPTNALQLHTAVDNMAPGPSRPIKRDIGDIESNEYKRAKVEGKAKDNHVIELDDDDEDCIDLTEENDDLLPIDYFSTSQPVLLDEGDGDSLENEDYDSDLEEVEDYLSAPWNQRPHNGMPPPPFTGVTGAGSEYRYDRPDFSLFEGDSFGFHHYGSHMDYIARDIARRRLPEVMTRPMPTQLSVEQTEKELRELLEHVEYDDPPPPEQREETPPGLNISLLEHQKIGVAWMAKMERSSNKGGILADDMGLGKTIQAMATIVANPCEDADFVDHSLIPRNKRVINGDSLKIKATLIVCPVSLIDQWRREIETKTDPILKVLVFHGNTRPSNPYDLALYDVIISSYAITAGNYSEQCKGPFASVRFHRVILDEAHTIKNKNTRSALGCCNIDATYRWCMTATPIQNKIDELYSLIKFLRIRPFCEWEEFRDCISKPMKDGNHKKAIKVSQLLMKAISYRRSKKATIDGRPILQLPERNVNMTHIDFSPDERIHYEYVNQTALARFNKYMKQGTVMKNYSSVLVLLLRLRQACLHPSLTLQEGDTPEEEAKNQDDLAAQLKPEVVQRLLNESSSLSQIECPICMDIAQNAQIIAGCGHVLCKECFDSFWNVTDGNRKVCPQCRGEISDKKLVTVDAFLKKHAPDLYEAANEPVKEEEKKDLKNLAEFLTSAKIEKMMELLDQADIESDGQDKTIVFSQFTAMLDLIERPLKDKGFKYLRYDGSMDIKERAQTVNKFFDDPETRLLLVSTKAGSLGLNLTVANRVILLDVWWNPALENQAIDRVHRIGQEKDVHVHRIFINNTVEDRILELQNKKQAIADGVLGEGTGQPISRLGLQEMIYLFRGGDVPDPAAAAGAGPGPSTMANQAPQANARPSQANARPPQTNVRPPQANAPPPQANVRPPHPNARLPRTNIGRSTQAREYIIDSLELVERNRAQAYQQTQRRTVPPQAGSVPRPPPQHQNNQMPLGNPPRPQSAPASSVNEKTSRVLPTNTSDSHSSNTAKKESKQPVNPVSAFGQAMRANSSSANKRKGQLIPARTQHLPTVNAPGPSTPAQPSQPNHISQNVPPSYTPIQPAVNNGTFNHYYNQLPQMGSRTPQQSGGNHPTPHNVQAQNTPQVPNHQQASNSTATPPPSDSLNSRSSNVFHMPKRMTKRP